MRVSTFNLNNLFDRFNFAVQLEQLPSADEIAAQAIKVDFEDGQAGHPELDPAGRLVKAKPLADRIKLADRIRALDADLLLVQEVEHRDALLEFNSAPADQGGLGGMYSTAVCIDGNDPRRIDVGVLSRVPLGGVTTWQHAIHPDLPARRIFSRDLLEIDILSPDFSSVRATCFVTHLKSKLVQWKRGQTPADIAAAQADNDHLRGLQADMITRILERRELERPFLVCGDMNDSPASTPLTPLRTSPLLVEGLAGAVEHPAYTLAEEDPPASPLWTHRFREHGQTSYELFDQIWVSHPAAELLQGAGILRRTHKTGDGTDHDAAWVDLNLP